MYGNGEMLVFFRCSPNNAHFSKLSMFPMLPIVYVAYVLGKKQHFLGFSVFLHLYVYMYHVMSKIENTKQLFAIKNSLRNRV